MVERVMLADALGRFKDLKFEIDSDGNLKSQISNLNCPAGLYSLIVTTKDGLRVMWKPPFFSNGVLAKYTAMMKEEGNGPFTRFMVPGLGNLICMETDLQFVTAIGPVFA